MLFAAQAAQVLAAANMMLASTHVSPSIRRPDVRRPVGFRGRAVVRPAAVLNAGGRLAYSARPGGKSEWKLNRLERAGRRETVTAP
jgi:hypothetical protein